MIYFSTKDNGFIITEEELSYDFEIIGDNKLHERTYPFTIKGNQIIVNQGRSVKKVLDFLHRFQDDSILIKVNENLHIFNHNYYNTYKKERFYGASVIRQIMQYLRFSDKFNYLTYNNAGDRTYINHFYKALALRKLLRFKYFGKEKQQRLALNIRMVSNNPSSRANIYTNITTVKTPQDVVLASVPNQKEVDHVVSISKYGWVIIHPKNTKLSKYTIQFRFPTFNITAFSRKKGNLKKYKEYNKFRNTLARDMLVSSDSYKEDYRVNTRAMTAEDVEGLQFIERRLQIE